MLRLHHRRATAGNAGRDPGAHLRHQVATFVDARIKWVRDRALDHAVEKEKNLRPLLALKNLVFSEPAKSLPVAVAADLKLQLGLPNRAVDFIRRHPAVFTEFPGPADPRRPHVRLTPAALELHDHEHNLYESCRSESADRLLKLLMLTPARRLPLHLVDRVRWDMGLPNDYVRSILPDYPDYFELTTDDSTQQLWIDLVCYKKELTVSAMERRAEAADSGGYKKGAPLAFPMQFSRGFDMEKKVKKWVEEWQKLPYISPYEDGWHLDPKSDIGEKWAVGMLHELLHLFVGKKAEKETILAVGAHLGLRPGFKRAFNQYPGIFYLSNKIRTHTIVLREAYKRDLLVEKHPLMGVRYQWIHLMHKEVEAGKSRTNSSTAPKVASVVEDGGAGGEEEVYGSSDETSDDVDGEEQSGYKRDDDVGRRETRRNGGRKAMGMMNVSSVRSSPRRRFVRSGGRALV